MPPTPSVTATASLTPIPALPTNFVPFGPDAGDAMVGTYYDGEQARGDVYWAMHVQRAG